MNYLRNVRVFNKNRKPAIIPTPPRIETPVFPKPTRYRTESIEKFLCRGGRITKCPTRHAENCGCFYCQYPSPKNANTSNVVVKLNHKLTPTIILRKRRQLKSAA